MVDDEDLAVVLGEDKKVGDESDPVEELNRQFEALKKDNERRKEAEAAANRRAADERAAAEQARQEAQLVRASLADREADTVESRIDAARAEAESAVQEYIAAGEAGDFKKQIDAQRKVSRAEARLVHLESTKAELELRKTLPRNEPQSAPSRPSDPFEDHLTRFTPRTADWMRRNRDWVTDTRKNTRLVSAHHVAVAAGMEPDTDDYFAHVEKTLGIGQPEVEPPAKTQQTTRRTAPMVAPVNGGGGANSSGSGGARSSGEVRLSKGEQERATDGSIVWNRGNTDAKGEVLKDGDPRIGKPIGINEYARRKQQLEKTGHYDKMYSHG